SYIQGFLDGMSAEKNIIFLGTVPYISNSKIIQLASLQEMLDQPILKKRLWQFMQNRSASLKQYEFGIKNMKQQVVVLSQIDADIQNKLEQHYDVAYIQTKLGDVNRQLLQEVQDADGMIGAGRLLNRDNLATATRLKVISSVSVGYDNYELDYLNEKNI